MPAPSPAASLAARDNGSLLFRLQLLIAGRAGKRKRVLCAGSSFLLVR